jgi:hypothetical protein
MADAMEDGDSAGEEFGDGVERFDGDARAAGEIHDYCLAADGGNSA